MGSPAARRCADAFCTLYFCCICQHAQDLAIVGYAVAKLGLRPPQTWLRRYCALLLKHKAKLYRNKTLLTQVCGGCNRDEPRTMLGSSCLCVLMLSFGHLQCQAALSTAQPVAQAEPSQQNQQLSLFTMLPLMRVCVCVCLLLSLFVIHRS